MPTNFNIQSCNLIYNEHFNEKLGEAYIKVCKVIGHFDGHFDPEVLHLITSSKNRNTDV